MSERKHVPGYKTSEFYLTLLTHLLTGALTVGLVPAGTPVKIATISLSALAQLGYSVSRALVKK